MNLYSRYIYINIKMYFKIILELNKASPSKTTTKPKVWCISIYLIFVCKYCTKYFQKKLYLSKYVHVSKSLFFYFPNFQNWKDNFLKLFLETICKNKNRILQAYLQNKLILNLKKIVQNVLADHALDIF